VGISGRGGHGYRAMDKVYENLALLRGQLLPSDTYCSIREKRQSLEAAN